MAKTASLNIRIDPSTKANAEALFASFGITLSEAVTIFLNQSLMEGGLPFAVKQPRYNAETEAAMQEARAILNGTQKAPSYDSARALFDELDTETETETCAQ